MRECIDRTLYAHAAVGAPATWVLSNHDVTRTSPGTAGRHTFSFDNNSTAPGRPGAGHPPGRAAALLSLSLPGAAYIYQGEELGLWENEAIPPEQFQDPMWARRGHSRDGCRVPLPWAGDEPPFGFTSPCRGCRSRPSGRTARAGADRDPNSMLELYRSAIAVRHAEPGLHGPAMAWIELRPGVLAYTAAPASPASSTCPAPPWRCRTTRPLCSPADRSTVTSSPGHRRVAAPAYRSLIPRPPPDPPPGRTADRASRRST